MNINGYNLSHRFYEWAFENRQAFKPVVPALYFYLVEVCNKLGWKKEFSISSKECMEGMGVSAYNTYKEAFDILCDNGFISVVKKSCNHHQANIISLSNFNKVDDNVNDKLFNNAEYEWNESSYESNCDIHKTIKPTKQSKPVKQNKNPQEKKIEYAEFVSMKEDEYKKLVEIHTQEGANRMIEILNNYKGANGKKYKSDYMAILNWVVERYNNEKQKDQSNQTSKKNSKGEAGTFTADEYIQKDYSERFDIY